MFNGSANENVSTCSSIRAVPREIGSTPPTNNLSESILRHRSLQVWFEFVGIGKLWFGPQLGSCSLRSGPELCYVISRATYNRYADRIANFTVWTASYFTKGGLRDSYGTMVQKRNQGTMMALAPETMTHTLATERTIYALRDGRAMRPSWARLTRS